MVYILQRMPPKNVPSFVAFIGQKGYAPLSLPAVTTVMQWSLVWQLYYYPASWAQNESCDRLERIHLLPGKEGHICQLHLKEPSKWDSRVAPQWHSRSSNAAFERCGPPLEHSLYITYNRGHMFVVVFMNRPGIEWRMVWLNCWRPMTWWTKWKWICLLWSQSWNKSPLMSTPSCRN